MPQIQKNTVSLTHTREPQRSMTSVTFNGRGGKMPGQNPCRTNTYSALVKERGNYLAVTTISGYMQPVVSLTPMGGK